MNLSQRKFLTLASTTALTAITTLRPPLSRCQTYTRKYGYLSGL